MVSEVQLMPTKMTFLVSDEVRETLQRIAREQRRSMTGVIEYLIMNANEPNNKQIEEAFSNGYEKGHEAGYEKAEEKLGEEYEEKLTAEYERGYEEGHTAD